MGQAASLMSGVGPAGDRLVHAGHGHGPAAGPPASTSSRGRRPRRPARRRRPARASRRRARRRRRRRPARAAGGRGWSAARRAASARSRGSGSARRRPGRYTQVGRRMVQAMPGRRARHPRPRPWPGTSAARHRGRRRHRRDRRRDATPACLARRDQALGAAGIDLHEGVALPGLLDGQAREGQRDDQLVDAGERGPQAVQDHGRRATAARCRRGAGRVRSRPARRARRRGGRDGAAPGRSHCPRNRCRRPPAMVPGIAPSPGHRQVRRCCRWRWRGSRRRCCSWERTSIRWPSAPTRPERHLVLDAVVHAHAVLDRREAVLVHPRLVGALVLDVAEAVGRLDLVDERAPPTGMPNSGRSVYSMVEPTSVDGCAVWMLEPHRAWRDASEVLGPREERPHSLEVRAFTMWVLWQRCASSSGRSRHVQDLSIGMLRRVGGMSRPVYNVGCCRVVGFGRRGDQR